MAIKRRKFTKGIRIKPNTEALEADGEITIDSADDKIKASLGGSDRAVVTEDQTQTLENKTIDATAATGNNTLSADSADIVYNDATQPVSSLGTDVQSALDAVKVALDGQNEASEIGYTPAQGTDWTDPDPTDVKAGLDQTASRITVSEGDVSDLTTLSGVAGNSTDLGTFTGATIADNETVKGALQDLEDSHEAHTGASTGVHGVTGSVVGTSDTQTLTNKTIQGASIETPSRLDVKQDTEANLITYAGTAADGQIVFATDTQKMYQIIDNALEPIGGGGSTSFEIAQVAHGFAVGNGIYHNGTTWVKAQANDADTLAYHVVVEVVDVDTFIAADFGRIEVPSHGYTVGEYYFLSDSVAGQATTTEPGSGFSNPLFYVEDANTLQIKCLRPNAVGDNILLDELSDVSVPAPTDGQALIWDNGNSRWEAKDVAGTAADITYDNSTSGLTATDTQAAIDEVEGRVDTLEAATTALNDLSDVSVASPNDGEVLTYNSTSGDWESIKAPSSQINYIENNDFEVDTTGWTGDTNLVISKEDVASLRGTGSLKIAKAAADASGEQVYTDFTIDSADLAKKLTITFDIDASDANYSDDDMKVKIIKDPTGTPVDISVNGQEIKGGKFQYIGQFQTDATELNYRLVIEQVSAQTSAVNIIIDNVQVGPREVAKGAAMTDWIDYTPTGSWTTNTTYTGKYRRVGDSMEVQVQIALSGVPNATILSVDIPSGLTIDTSKLELGSQASPTLGHASIRDAGTRSYHGTVGYTDTNSVLVYVFEDSSTFEQFSVISSTNPITFTASDEIIVNFSVPIAGWSSNAQMSEDLGGREIVVEGAGNGGTSITASTTDVDFTETRDTTSSWDGTQFTAPETGEYSVSGGVFINAVNSLGIYAYVDGSNNKVLGRIENTTVGAFKGTVKLEKGQVLTIRLNVTSTLSNNSINHHIHIQKLASPQTILETETVAARYSSNSGQSIPDSTQEVLVYEDSHGDTHNAYNTSTGEYTIPISGWYNVSAALQYDNASFNAGITHEIAIRINGSDQIKDGREVNATNTTRPSNSVSGNLLMEKGDVVTITTFQNTGSNKSVRANSSRNTFSIARIK